MVDFTYTYVHFCIHLCKTSNMDSHGLLHAYCVLLHICAFLHSFVHEPNLHENLRFMFRKYIYLIIITQEHENAMVSLIYVFLQCVRVCIYRHAEFVELIEFDV